MFISDDRAVIDTNFVKAVHKIDEKRFYSENKKDFDPIYFLSITYKDDTDSILIPYEGDKDGRNMMFNRLRKLFDSEYSGI